MSLSDPIADMLTRIRNACMVNKSTVVVPFSNLKKNILDVLEREGYIRGSKVNEVRTGVQEINVELKYNEGESVIQKLERVSKPGRRSYNGAENVPAYFNGLGISILSTSKGLLSDSEAREQKVGGEVICRVF